MADSSFMLSIFFHLRFCTWNRKQQFTLFSLAMLWVASSQTKSLKKKTSTVAASHTIALCPEELYNSFIVLWKSIQWGVSPSWFYDPLAPDSLAKMRSPFTRLDVLEFRDSAMIQCQLSSKWGCKGSVLRMIGSKYNRTICMQMPCSVKYIWTASNR